MTKRMKVSNFPIGVSAAKLVKAGQGCINYDLLLSITCCECWLPPDTLLALIRAQPWHRVTCSDIPRPMRSSTVNNIRNFWFYQHWKLSDWSDSRQHWQLPQQIMLNCYNLTKKLYIYIICGLPAKLSEPGKVLDRKFWWWMWRKVPSVFVECLWQSCNISKSKQSN